MNRRIRKVRRILRDAPEGIQDGMADFLDVAADVVDETQTYPGFNGLVDLDELDDSEYNDVLDAHDRLGKAFDKWAGIVERLGEE